jgi:serine/threonine protein kinase
MSKSHLVKADMVNQIKLEIGILQRLRHPNIVNLYEVMASKDKIYLVMEFVSGGELYDRVVAEGPLKVRSRQTDRQTDTQKDQGCRHT